MKTAKFNKTKTKQRKSFLIFYFLIFFFTVVLFVTRILAQAQYDALEDEILAIGNNLEYSMPILLLAPDFTHPGLWYFLMDPLVSFLGLSHGILYYRLVQILLLFILLSWSIFYFRKKFSHKFFIVFLLLFLSNIYLIHITSQYRMYSMVLSIGTFYSFYWLSIIKNKQEQISNKDCLWLAVIAALGFFTNYSMVWLIPIWPIAYLLSKHNKLALKNFFMFVSFFILLISWFIPIFVRNARDSIAANQWASDLNFINAAAVFGNYFGIIPFSEGSLRLSTLLYECAAIILLTVIIYSFFRQRTDMLFVLLSAILSFALFLLVVHLTGKSLLYARTSISLVIAFYVLLAYAMSVLPDEITIFLCTSLLLVQLSQFMIYFNPASKLAYDHDDFNYRRNPISYFHDYDFAQDACLIPSPYWNANINRFFLGDVVKIMPVDQLETSTLMQNLQDCAVIYLLEQTSVDRSILDAHRTAIFQNNCTFKTVDTYENQDLQIVSCQD